MVEDRTYLLSRVFSSSRLSESKWLYMHPSEEEDSSESKLLRNGKRALDDDDDDELRQSKSLKRMGLPIHKDDSDSDQQ
ncbi:hypothetical protein Bca52824_062799 [Brassica carinata]|uniref:Uncharacterized protein n=1 Tax=Brassica carinata TaxID=52824 RepID=A0A8X7U7L3_BRACI|nr:hypothetical protein Bca52824_062799 [Brassica carinata]